jgi:hypothetical protein
MSFDGPMLSIRPARVASTVTTSRPVTSGIEMRS